MEVSNVKIEKRTNDEKKLAPFVKLMEKYGTKNPMKLLPQTQWHKVSFVLDKTSSSMANAIRRVLIEELHTRCLTFDDEVLTTDDEFILTDVLQKNIELLPINQDGKNFAGKKISLYKYNDTNDVIDVKASDLTISKSNTRKQSTAESKSEDPPKSPRKSPKSAKRKTKRGAAEDVSIRELIPDSNIAIISLRPGKFVRIDEITFLEGYSKYDAGKFTLLDNVTYDIMGVEPFDQFTGKGTRSMEYDPSKFSLSFKTCGNISPKGVIDKLVETLMSKLARAKDFVSTYAKSDQTKQYYYTEGFEVSISDDIVTYKFHNEYITLSNMLAHRCYVLDNNILFCSPAVERLDNEVGIVRLKHADCNTLLLNAIDECIADIQTFSKAFK